VLYNKQAATGYCIRTGREIPFDLDMPYFKDAFRTWSQLEIKNTLSDIAIFWAI
jgi:hypothetical protein